MKRKYKRFITLLLAFAIVASIASATIIAKAVDLSRSCSLYVKPGSSEYAGEVKEANVVLDVYQIAAAEESNYDRYTFSFIGPYSGFELSEAPDSDEWGAISQKAAKIAVSYDTPVTTAPLETTIGGLASGLYLVIARGEDLTNYVEPYVDDEGNEKIATIALSGSQKISFAPVLVSLPTKEADDDDRINSANPGEWIYDSTISLKPEMDKRFGAMEIISNLEGYVTGSPATFVYDIEAVLNGERVYSDVISETLKGEGTQSTLVEGIPVGAVVTVTEVYSGVCYELTGSSNQMVVVDNDEVVSVSFTNRPDDSLLRGGGFTDHFWYSEVWHMETILHD